MTNRFDEDSVVIHTAKTTERRPVVTPLNLKINDQAETL